MVAFNFEFSCVLGIDTRWAKSLHKTTLMPRIDLQLLKIYNVGHEFHRNYLWYKHVSVLNYTAIVVSCHCRTTASAILQLQLSSQTTILKFGFLVVQFLFLASWYIVRFQHYFSKATIVSFNQTCGITELSFLTFSNIS